MMAGSHVVLGAAAWCVAAPHLGVGSLDPVALGLAVAGSLLPDIDHPKSWVGQRARPFSTVVAAVLGHRGATHSLLALGVCCWLLLQDGLPRAIVAPLLVGYLSHLAADLLTPRGLRLAWPLKGVWALPLCRSGSASEPLVVAALVLVAACSAASPQARQSLIGVTPICGWVGPDGFAGLCPPRRAHPADRPAARGGATTGHDTRAGGRRSAGQGAA